MNRGTMQHHVNPPTTAEQEKNDGGRELARFRLTLSADAGTITFATVDVRTTGRPHEMAYAVRLEDREMPGFVRHITLGALDALKYAVEEAEETPEEEER